MNNPATRALRAVGASLTAAALACAALALGAAPASAAPQVTVDAPGGIAIEGETAVTVSGTGFQSIRGGFGGIYVLFGTVTSDNWQPSKGGVTGKDYSYAADDETKPAGYESLVVFPGSATSYAATGGEISADGSWQSKLTIPGAKFTTYDRSGNASEVDCTTVQCGIITIGAHGQINANNESFTPVTFSSSAVGAPAGAAAQQTGPSAGADEEPQSSGTSPAAPSPSAAPRAGGSGAGTAGSAGTPITIQTSSPDSEVRLSTIFLLVGVGLLGLALVVLAAGFGGFLAVKSIVLGLSPVAVEREGHGARPRPTAPGPATRRSGGATWPSTASRSPATPRRGRRPSGHLGFCPTRPVRRKDEMSAIGPTGGMRATATPVRPIR